MELDALVPAAFVQVNVYVTVPGAAGVSTTLPPVACAPLQPPDAVQAEAAIVVHVKVAEAPSSIEGADKVSVGITSAESAWMKP
jgi:hypothetical protein